MNRLAIVAHFDPEQQFDLYLQPLIDQLAAACTRVVVVSTSGVVRTHFALPANVQIVTRPNQGYDWCSFRHGLEFAQPANAYPEVILTNDSYYTTDRFTVKRILQDAEYHDGGVVGISENRQFARHVQSYFLILRKWEWPHNFFFQFWSGVYPVRSKLELIFLYEIGMSQAILARQGAVAALFRPPLLARVREGLKAGFNGLRDKGSIRYALAQMRGPKNPTYAHFRELERAYGVVKTDVARLHGVESGNMALLRRLGLSDAARAHLARTSGFHKGRRLSDTSGVVPAGEVQFFDCVTGRERPKASMAVVWHLYHFDLLEPILRYLDRIPFPCDVFVSLTDVNHLATAVRVISSVANRLHVYCRENRGRDMKPFIDLLETRALDDYACAVKLHTKKSDYSRLGSQWRDALIDTLLPSGPVIAGVARTFQEDRTLGIVASFSSYISTERHWGGNKDRVDRYAERMGLEPERRRLFFVAGSMFWFSPTALQPMLAAVKGEPFEDEQGQRDATLAHVIERLPCLSSLSVGMRCSPMEDLTASLSDRDVASNTVAVLE